MLLSKSDLLVNESYLNNRESIIDSNPINENFSFFSFGLDCLRESNQEIRSMMVNLYNSAGYTNESMVEDVMKEFSEKFSFKKVVSFIIDKFKELLKKICIKAKNFLLKLIAPVNTIKKHYNEIKNYNKPIKVDFEHYNYTYLDVDVPQSDLNMKFTKEYEDLLVDLKDLAKDASKEELIQKLDVYYQELNRSIGDNYYNQLRAEITLNKNSNDPITKERYIGKLWSLFRNNETATYSKNKEIMPDEIHTTLDRYVNSHSLIKGIETSRSKVEAVTEKMKTSINKISPLDFMSKYVPIDYDIEFAVDRILKLKCGQLAEMCNIYVLAFNTKLDAIKEAIIQDRKVLFIVLNDIMTSKVGKEEV